MRKIQFQNGEYYHIHNRGVEKRKIFENNQDYLRFLTSLREFNQLEPIESLYRLNQIKKVAVGPLLKAVQPLVKIVSYCLNPNHYHLILKQVSTNGISEFIKRLAGGYTWYFNNKHNRSGSLFQGRFKATHINNYSYLLKILVYVNCNHEIHGLGKSENWPWSSFFDAIGKRNEKLCDLNLIREEFKSPKEFQEFCAEIIPEIRDNKELQEFTLK